MIFPGKRVFVHLVQQMEAAECGIACVVMVAGYHGYYVPVAEIRELCGTSRDGNSALDLLRGARRLNLEGRGLSVSLSALRELKLPAILHWDMNHFVVLEAVGRGFVRIVDPASGRKRVSWSDVDRLFSGVALELSRGPGFKRRARSSVGLQRYALALRKARAPLAFVCLANSVAQALALTFPAASQVLIDHVIVPSRREWLVPVLGAMAFGALGQLILTQLQRGSLAVLQGMLGIELTTELGRRIANLPLPFVDSRSHGDLLQRVHVQEELQRFVASAAQAFFDLVAVLLLGGLMLAYDSRLGSLAIGLIVLRFFVVHQLRAFSEERVAAELAARGREKGVVVEATRCPELIKGLGIESRIVQRYLQRITERAGFSIRSERFQKAASSWLVWASSGMEALILWYGGLRVIDGSMTLGVLSGFLAIRAMVEVPIATLVGLYEGWVRFQSALHRSDDILSVASVTDGHVSAAGVVGRIEVTNLGFRYGTGGRWIVRNVNLTLEAGEKVAFVGPSGQGKSTLCKLLVGLLEPSEGQVLLDGLPVADYSRETLASKLGVVLQEPLILEGSIGEVLRLRDPEASVEAVTRAAELACFDDIVRRLPRAYETRLAPQGSNLSGGERQRLALAQALLGSPRLLLLDEATCALDPPIERRVLDNLALLPATVLTVAHRAAVIHGAERVFSVSGGEVTEIDVEADAGSARPSRSHAATESGIYELGVAP